MSCPESQKLIDAACDQVHCVILDVMIQEKEKKLKEDREACKTLLAQRQSDRKHLRVKKPKKLKKPTLAQLQLELAELHWKYTQLCTKLETTE